MTVNFNDYFWGEKNNGYDVLYHNMKYGLVASKELSEFLRERSNIEEHYSKLLSKLAKQAGSCSINGTFAPVWQILKTSAEQLSTLHMQMVQKVVELVKDINKYADELHKKHKVVKEDESGTLEAVQAIQSITLMVQKAKDLYSQRNLEVEKLKKEGATPKDIEKSEVKLKKAFEDYKTFVEKYSVTKEDFEKRMTVTNQHFQEIEEAHLIQMKQFLETYSEVVQTNHDLVGQVHTDFRRQCLELTADKLMEVFCLSKYTGLEKPGLIELDELSSVSKTQNVVDKDRINQKGNIVQTLGNSNTQTQGKSSKRDSNQQSHDITGMQAANQTWSPPTQATKHSRRTTSLLNLFMSNPHGNKELKGNCPNSAPSSPSIPTSIPIGENREQHIIRNPLRGSKWFLRSRRDKAKLKKAKKKKDADNTSNKEEKSDMEEKDDTSKTSTTAEAENETPEIDEDGFYVRPKSTATYAATNDKNSFYSSSDSDSDDERDQKIHVEIKPLNNGTAPMSASVDELRATVENLSLSPLNMLGRRNSNSECQDTMIKRSQSMSQQLGSKPSNDLLGLGLGLGLGSPVASNASTPISTHPYAPLQSPSVLQSPSQLTLNSPTLSSSRYADLGDIFSEVGDIQPGTTKSARQTPTPTSGYMSIPRPPSRKSEGLSPRGHISPSPISRADSVGSLEFRTACVPVGVSRGPSPLTIGMADTVPLAVAFHEIVHSYFRGTDETKCQVKMSGDMMLSFPAGIVTILTNNPNPAKLVFRVRNIQRLTSILPNKQLVSIDNAQSGTDNLVLEFIMSALSSLLKRQSEQNPGASYFNVDILKYQIKSKPGANSCPFQLVAYWKCEKSHTDLKVDYKYNSHAMSAPSPLLNVMVAVPVDGGVKSMQSKPTSQWISETNRVLWKFTELSQHSDNHGVGSMRARFELETGPSLPSTISTQFNCEGTTLSGIDFQLIGPGYRLSLVKRRFVSGKYICDGDLSDLKNKYSSTTPSPACDAMEDC